MIKISEFGNTGHGFVSRRSTVMATGAMIATSHPLASEAGLHVLRSGGNAVDAAIATAATLCVVEPMFTGIGGDAFSLVWWNAHQNLYGLNGSGRAPGAESLERLVDLGYTSMPSSGPLSITVPGTVDAWHTLHERFGRLPLRRLFDAALHYARDGFPVTEIVAKAWKRGEPKLAKYEDSRRVFLSDGRAPVAGQRFRLPELADSIEQVADGGRDAFYRGSLGASIVEACQDAGSLLSSEDLTDHASTWDEPIKTTYRGLEVFECSPNSQGLAALVALNIVEGWDLRSIGHNSGPYLHKLIEATKLGLADALQHVADPAFSEVPVAVLLSKEYAAARRGSVRQHAASSVTSGHPSGRGSDTVYFTVVDEDRNVVSFINSTYDSFGSGVVAGKTGVVMQNRGAGFSLDRAHPNRLAPGKRPFHTIIPSMVFRDGRPIWSLGVVGGGMQPQGHLQVICNLLDFGMSVQEAVDAPRYRHLDGAQTLLQDGIPADAMAYLTKRQHRVMRESESPYGFGGCQIIQLDHLTGNLYGGSDPRLDGNAVGY